MCTLIVAHKVFTDYSLVVVANRDELLDRPSEPPAMRDDEYGIYAPRDLTRGGTWIGINQFGVLAALTNRLDVKSLRGRFSRGEVVMRALRHETASQAYKAMVDLARAQHNGFNLVIADQDHLFMVRSNGRSLSLSPEPEGLLVVTNHGIGRTLTSEMPRRVTHVLRLWETEQVATREPTLENLSPLLHIHDKWRHGTCISQPEENYGTKSSSFVRLGADKFEYFHRERPSLEKHVCEGSFGEKFELKINPPA